MFGASAQTAIDCGSERTAEVVRQGDCSRLSASSALNVGAFTLVDDLERSGYGSASGLRLF